MKKLLLIFIIGFMTINLFGQSQFKKGIKVGKNASVATIKDITSDGTDVKIFNASGDTLAPYTPVASRSDLSDYAVLLHPDTVSISANRTLVLTDDGKRIYAGSASGIEITLPPSSSVAFTKESTIYVQQTGAGPVVFKPGTGVTIYSELDSIALNTQWRWAAVIYRGNNNYVLIGTKD